MGCAQSKIENEESVIRCKNRKLYMRDAVSSRNAFAAAQAAYAVALKNTGAALSDFGQSELHDLGPASHPPSAASASASSSSAASASAVAIQPPMDSLPPPPPPPPDSTSSSSSLGNPLVRSASMPADLAIPKSNKKFPSKIPAEASIREEDEAERADDSNSAAGSASPAPPPKPQPQQARPASPPIPAPASETWDYFFASNEHMMPPTLSQPEETTWTDTRELEEEERGNIASTMITPPPPVPTDDVRGDQTLVKPEKVVNEPTPAPPKQVKKIKYGGPVDHQLAASAGASETKRSKTVAASVNLIQILNELDDHFLKASESAHDVSKMLEATRMHYHSNFADNRGHIDHSAMVMRVITWNRSFKGMSQADSGKDDFDNDEWETHATILDKMLAWEKKLYDEVKAGELMKIEYQRKVALLNKHNQHMKHGGSSASLEKIKSAVSHLHTRYIVDMQSMDSTVSEINRLRDHHLYVKLVDLVNGMARMWESMCSHHGSQFKMIKDIRALDFPLAPRETSQQHHKRTIQLHTMVGEWDSQFQKLLSNQKDYIKALNRWLNLNLVPLEHSGKEGSAPQRAPPIRALLYAWQDQLEHLPFDQAKSAISSFSAAIHAIVICQFEELNLKLKWEDSRRDYDRKRQEFQEWDVKYSERMVAAASSDEANPERTKGAHLDAVSERKAAVENAEIRMKAAEESYKKQCKLVRDKSVATLRTHLPELFRAMAYFAGSCSVMYKRLASLPTKPESPVVNDD